MKALNTAKRIVLKIGSALLTDADTGTLKNDWLASLASEIAEFPDKEWIVVSSGAIALGRPSLKIDKDVKTSDLTLEQKQACAAIGQVRLANAFSAHFKEYKHDIAQILLSIGDTEDRRSHLNARSTIDTLLSYGIIPVINENDTVATEEIRFGDNDRLAARVAQMMEADLMILLSTTDGLYDKNPDKHADAQHIGNVESIDEELFSYADKQISAISTGGMISKLEAAKIATNSGCRVIITDGRHMPCLASEKRHTLFKAADSPEKARKKWIKAHLNTRGEVLVDEGAAQALKNGKSLLPVGVKEVRGDFRRGDPVLVKDLEERLIARGLIAYDIEHAMKIAGVQTASIPDIIGFKGRPELIHRDDLVVEL